METPEQTEPKSSATLLHPRARLLDICSESRHRTAYGLAAKAFPPHFAPDADERREASWCSKCSRHLLQPATKRWSEREAQTCGRRASI